MTVDPRSGRLIFAQESRRSDRIGFLRREYVAISSQNQPNFWKSTILEPCRGARRRRRRQSGGPPLPLQQPLYLYRRVLQRAGFLAVDTHAAPRGFDVRLE